MARKKTEPMGTAPSMPRDHAARERKYQVQDALRTLTQAEDIRRDKALMRDVKKEAATISRVVSKPNKGK